MNKNGQVTIGALIIVFVIVIVGATLLSPIASNVEAVRSTQFLANTSVDTGAVNTTIEIPGSGIVGTVIALNQTGSVLNAAEFTVGSRQPPITGGVVTNTFLPESLEGASQEVNLTYTAEPDGFDTSTGGRAIILLVIIFAALAIAVVTAVPALRSGVVELMRG